MKIKERIYEIALLHYRTGSKPNYQTLVIDQPEQKLHRSLSLKIKIELQYFDIEKIHYQSKNREEVISKINKELKDVYQVIDSQIPEKYIGICKECSIAYMSTSMKKITTRKCHNCNTVVDYYNPLGKNKQSVYLMRSHLTGLLKIGISQKPSKRRRTLETAQGGKIDLITVIDGGKIMEKELHEMFCHLRRDGEWFDYDNSIIDRFNKLKESQEMA
jgi:hypothetical protein